MAMNFKIVQLKGKNSVQLNLGGDFDGTSAHELINALKICARHVDKVFIDTSGLTLVHPFGRIVLHRNLSGLCGRCVNLVFLGQYGRILSRSWVQ